MARGHYGRQISQQQDQDTSRGRQVIKRGLLMSFNNATYTANVLVMEATSAYLSGVPVACHMDGTSAQVNAPCAVLFFDEQNSNDACIIAIYPNSTEGIPTPPPGRTTFTTGYRHINASVINAGVTTSFTIIGSGGIPTGALGILYKAYFTSATVHSYIELAPKSGTITDYATIGWLSVANDYLNGCGVLQLDSAGKIDIKANTGNCTVTLYTHGYIY